MNFIHPSEITMENVVAAQKKCIAAEIKLSKPGSKGKHIHDEVEQAEKQFGTVLSLYIQNECRKIIGEQNKIRDMKYDYRG